MSTSQWSATNSLTTKAGYLPTNETAILTPTPGGGFGNSIDISSDGNYAIVEATGERYAYIFLRSGNTWPIQQKISTGDYCRKVSMDATGTRVTIGVGSGSSFYVLVYARSGTTWTYETQLTFPYGTSKFISSISGDGLTIIIGSYDWNSYNGICGIYTRSGTTWTYRAAFGAADSTTNLLFGIDVDINYNGTYAIIGTQRGSAGTNCFYVFTGAGASWAQQAKVLTPETENANGDYFGHKVSITDNGDRIITGAMFSSSGSGRAYIYNRIGSSWYQEAILTAPNPTNMALFGCSVSISKDGTKAIVGESDGDPPGVTNAGRAHLFSRSGSSWSLGATLYASDSSSSNDNFGYSVAISGDGTRVIVGDPNKNSNFGRAYAFS